MPPSWNCKANSLAPCGSPLAGCQSWGLALGLVPQQGKWQVTMGNQAVRLIVCEWSGRWRPALAAHLVGPATLRLVGSLAECETELNLAPRSVVALEWRRQSGGQQLDWAIRLARKFPEARLVVLGQPGDDDWQWLWREMGASHVVLSTSEAPALARLVCRHNADVTARFGHPSLDAWDLLPWPAAAPAK